MYIASSSGKNQGTSAARADWKQWVLMLREV